MAFQMLWAPEWSGAAGLEPFNHTCKLVDDMVQHGQFEEMRK